MKKSEETYCSVDQDTGGTSAILFARQANLMFRGLLTPYKSMTFLH